MNNGCKDHVGTRLRKISPYRCLFQVFALLCLALIAPDNPVLPRSNFYSRGDRVDPGSWSATSRPQAAQRPSSRRLNYAQLFFAHVTKGLSGIANVYLMASSASVGDPRLPRQIEASSSGLPSLRPKPRHPMASRIPALTRETPLPDPSPMSTSTRPVQQLWALRLRRSSATYSKVRSARRAVNTDRSRRGTTACCSLQKHLTEIQ